MKTFPEHLNCKKQHLFHSFNVERVEELFRNEIYDFIISRDTENEYFDIDIFNIKNNSLKFSDIFVDKIINELHQLGWKTKLSFGNTGLFIYSTDELPSSCW